jgi:hypothetical protein
MSSLLRGSMAAWSPWLMHAAAVFFERLARSCAGARVAFERQERWEDAAAMRARELESTVRRLAAWIALAADSSFAKDLVRQLAAGTLSDADVESIASGCADRVVDELGSVASRGAKDGTVAAAIALAALARSQDACKQACAPAALATKLVARADRARAYAIDDALASVEDALQEARARNAPAGEIATLLHRVRGIWKWADRDESVERFAVDQVTPIAWDVYRHSAWDVLRSLLAPCELLYDNLEARLLARPQDIAYAAKCAQILVFRSEADTVRAKEWLYAERALVVCPTHRNGRLILSHLLSDHAISVLGRSTIFSGRNDVAEMTPVVERAEKLFPQGTRTQEARSKLDEARARWGSR